MINFLHPLTATGRCQRWTLRFFAFYIVLETSASQWASAFREHLCHFPMVSNATVCCSLALRTTFHCTQYIYIHPCFISNRSDRQWSRIYAYKKKKKKNEKKLVKIRCFGSTTRILQIHGLYFVVVRRAKINDNGNFIEHFYICS